MIRNILALMLASAVLSGCVLQSRVALYKDKHAVLALGAEGGVARISSWKDGAWIRDGEPAGIAVKGRHYEASVKDGFVSLHFVALKGSWFVLQATEGGKPAVYMLAEVKNRRADIRPLSCDEIKKQQSTAWIAYEGDDCFIKPGAPAEKLFAALLKTPGAATSRLELMP